MRFGLGFSGRLSRHVRAGVSFRKGRRPRVWISGRAGGFGAWQSTPLGRKRHGSR